MLTLRSAHAITPLGTVLFRSHTLSSPSPLFLLQRQFHAQSSRRQEVQNAAAKDEEMPVKVSEQVLNDRSEPGWAMSHARYTEEGESILRGNIESVLYTYAYMSTYAYSCRPLRSSAQN
jgi:hypothetical protein